MHSSLYFLLTSLSLASAVPTAVNQRDVDPNIIDPWGEYGRKPQSSKLMLRDADLLELLSRQNPNGENNVGDFQGTIPNCADTDPSTSTKNTAYTVDQGVKIPKQGKDDECTTGHNSDHCWTEYWLVEGQVKYTNWENTGAAIDCGTTSQCSSNIAMLNQTCTSFSSSSTNGFDWKIIDASAQLGEGAGQASVGASWTFSHSDSTTNTKQACTASQANQQCTWDDKQCHQVWYADRVLHIWGQMERVCNGKSGGNVQQNTQRPNGGPWVRGQYGIEFEVPINKLVGCGAACGAQSYDGSKPADGDRKSFTKPDGW